MAGKKNKDIDMKDLELGDDGLPSDEDLDALQRAIDMEMDGMAQREAAAEASEAADDSDAKRIEELEAELTALKDKALRAMADADNVKKRAEREVAAAKTNGIERFAVDMLSVHDNLSRALLTLSASAIARRALSFSAASSASSSSIRLASLSSSFSLASAAASRCAMPSISISMAR